jgi:hypothetical protein
MKTITRVLAVLVFTGWAGSVFAEPITGADTATVDGIAVASADSAGEAVEQPPVITNTGQMAVRVFIDPETGELGGPPGVEPPGLSIATQNRLSRSSHGLQTRALPDGTVLLNLQGRFHNMSVVTLDEDGEVHLTCRHSVDHIEKALVHSVDVPVPHRGSAP